MATASLALTRSMSFSVTNSLGVGRIGEIEINAAFVLADSGAGNRERADNRQQVTGRMHAHQLVAPGPVYMQHQFFADCGCSLPLCRHMNDFVLVFAGNGRRNLYTRAVRTFEEADIPG